MTCSFALCSFSNWEMHRFVQIHSSAKGSSLLVKRKISINLYQEQQTKKGDKAKRERNRKKEVMYNPHMTNDSPLLENKTSFILESNII